MISHHQGLSSKLSVADDVNERSACFYAVCLLQSVQSSRYAHVYVTSTDLLQFKMLYGFDQKKKKKKY